LKAGRASLVTGRDGIGRKTGRLIVYAVTGFIFGYVVLHPISMLIFRWLDVSPSGMRSPAATAPDLLGPIIHSFQPDMLPMALVFGLFSLAMSLLDGLRREALTRRGDQLAQQLRLNEENRAKLKELVSKLRLKNSRLRRLERANRRSTQFMVHDLKNNLHCISGFAYALLHRGGEDRDPSDVDFLKRISRQCMQMKNSVKNLLDIARLNEQSDLHRQQYSAARLLSDVAEDLQYSFEGYQIELGDLYQQCPDPVIEPGLISRVLTNLVVNAVKHNEPGITVILDAEPAPEVNGVLFSCKDDGRGIRTELLPSLFDEFVSDGDRRNAHSTGLGLAFCRTAVAAHGGDLRVESEVGSGATFRFTIPGDIDQSSGAVEEQPKNTTEMTAPSPVPVG